ncbi:MAG: DUF2892 domain-containing protein [Chlamydiae bacterium]|nr:DUF2892 domain-containing protein [Chlamydiota bacterium]
MFRIKSNIGKKDRIIRFSIAMILFAYAAFQKSFIALGAAIFTLYEALAGWCILYQILGKSSCPIDKKKK